MPMEDSRVAYGEGTVYGVVTSRNKRSEHRNLPTTRRPVHLKIGTQPQPALLIVMLKSFNEDAGQF